MKIRLAFFLFTILMALAILPANKTGRASFAGKGNTGAPGDETLNGAPYTCTECHDDNAFNPSVTISVLDSTDAPVTHYRPGQLYTARVSIAATGAAGYGFQMIGLRDAGNTDLDGFTDINPNNYKLSTISNGRTYAEHPTMSTSNTFNVRWTAPTAGTGSVTFYAAGNAVNGNNSSEGDGAVITSLQLQEEGILAAGETGKANYAIQVFPNPVTDQARLEMRSFKNEKVSLSARDLAGNVVWISQYQLQAGINVYTIPAANWPVGTYFLTVKGTGKAETVKILKL